MIPSLPDTITQEQAETFAYDVVTFINEMLGEDLRVSDVYRVELTPGRALVKIGYDYIDPDGIRQPSSWGRGMPAVANMYYTTNMHTERTLPWIEALGLDPNSTMGIVMYGTYIQVEGFISDTEGRRRLRESDTREYQKFIVDIPIENGDSK